MSIMKLLQKLPSSFNMRRRNCFSLLLIALLIARIESNGGFHRTFLAGPRLTRNLSLSSKLLFDKLRGGDQEEATLDEKVHAAMKKLGLKPPDPETEKGEDAQNSMSTGTEESSAECKDGVCPTPDAPLAAKSLDETKGKEKEDPSIVAERIAEKMNVDPSLAWAALGATAKLHDDGSRDYDEAAARNMIQQELDMMESIPEDSPEVKQLVAEGFDPFLSRRALAFGEMNMDDARAILVADQMDEEEEREQNLGSSAYQEAVKEERDAQKFKTVTVDGNFDPSKFEPQPEAVPSMPQQSSTPKPVKKADVVFEATGAQIQELVLESPVPVLLDVYADWCSPCKALTPALEEMAIKAGGAFRLVKVNTDNERAVSGALEVQALPTVFGIRDGKIIHMFQGMPRSQEAMQNFMMGVLMPGGENNFDPPLTETEKKRYNDLSSKLVKMAGAACFSFSARERLQDRVSSRMDDLAEQTGDVLEAEESAKVLRSLMSNVIRNPYETKYRTVNLANKVIAGKVAKYPAGMSILKSVGFVANSDGSSMTLGKGKKIVNVSPFTVARDCIDKWIDKMRYEVAAAARKRKDEEARARLQAEAANEPEDEYDEEEEEEVDPDACTLKLRLDGKKKIHEIVLQADDPLKRVLKKLPIKLEEGEEVKITCAAKKLVIKSGDKVTMKKSLRDLGLFPAASLVVSIGSTSKAQKSAAKLSERTASQKKKKKGSHTMQSVGIYSTEDNAKGELIDGGGGVLYEQDVSDDDEDEEAQAPEESTEEQEELQEGEEYDLEDEEE